MSHSAIWVDRYVKFQTATVGVRLIYEKVSNRYSSPPPHFISYFNRLFSGSEAFKHIKIFRFLFVWVLELDATYIRFGGLEDWVMMFCTLLQPWKHKERSLVIFIYLCLTWEGKQKHQKWKLQLNIC